MRLRDRRRRRRLAAERAAMLRLRRIIVRVEGRPHRERWRALARAVSRARVIEFCWTAYPAIRCGEPARLGSFSILAED